MEASNTSRVPGSCMGIFEEGRRQEGMELRLDKSEVRTRELRSRRRSYCINNRGLTVLLCHKCFVSVFGFHR